MILYFIIPCYGNKVFSIAQNVYDWINDDDFTEWASTEVNEDLKYHDIQLTTKAIHDSHLY